MMAMAQVTLRYSDPLTRYLVLRYDVPGGPVIVGEYRDGQVAAAAAACDRRVERGEQCKVIDLERVPRRAPDGPGA